MRKISLFIVPLAFNLFLLSCQNPTTPQGNTALLNADQPKFSLLSSQTYSTDQTVKLSSTTDGATIYYTTDGSTPTTTSPSGTSPVSVTVKGSLEKSVTTTIKAMSVKSGMNNSSVASQSYTVDYPRVSFNPSGGSYNSSQALTLSTNQNGWGIAYTIEDGDKSSEIDSNGNPTSTSINYPDISVVTLDAGLSVSVSKGNAYTGSIPIEFSNHSYGYCKTVKSIAYSGTSKTPICVAVYTYADVVNPATFSIVSGTYTEDQSLILSADSGATIYYTTDGSTPTTSSMKYTGAISLTGSKTQDVSYNINAIASKDGMNLSSVATASYTISWKKLSAPTIAYAYNSGYTTVTASDQSGKNATLHIVDSSNIDHNSPFNLTSKDTVYAYAEKDGYKSSDYSSSISPSVYTVASISLTQISDASTHLLYQIDASGSYYFNYGDTSTFSTTSDFFTIDNYQYVRSDWINPNDKDTIEAGIYSYASKGNKVFYGTPGWLFVCKTSSSVILMRYTGSGWATGTTSTDFNCYNYSNETITAKEDDTFSFTWIN